LLTDTPPKKDCSTPPSESSSFTFAMLMNSSFSPLRAACFSGTGCMPPETGFLGASFSPASALGASALGASAVGASALGAAGGLGAAAAGFGLGLSP